MRKLYKKGVLKQKALPYKVISVGNVSFGGVGKTTVVIELSRWLKEKGFNVVVLSRGYRGEKEGSPCEVDLTTGDPTRVFGDEPCLIKLKAEIPVFVGKDRFLSGMMAYKKYKPDIAILDDGFQYLPLKRDIDIVILKGDEERKLFLREPVSSAFIFSDIILSGSVIYHNKAFLFKKYIILPDKIRNTRLFAFSGLGDNKSFFRDLKDCGVYLVGHMGFRDHHAYKKKDLDKLIKKAISMGADGLITTWKDAIKIKNKPHNIPLYVADVRLEMEDSFFKKLLDLLNR